jgi:hypothetical protein
MEERGWTFTANIVRVGLRCRAPVARQAHNLEVGGSIPPSATGQDRPPVENLSASVPPQYWLPHLRAARAAVRRPGAHEIPSLPDDPSRYYCDASLSGQIDPCDLPEFVPVIGRPGATIAIAQARRAGFADHPEGRPEILWRLYVGGGDLPDGYVLRSGRFVSLAALGGCHES